MNDGLTPGLGQATARGTTDQERGAYGPMHLWCFQDGLPGGNGTVRFRRAGAPS